MKTRHSLSPSGFRMIKLFEGLRLQAYKDKAGVWTIGYGSTYYQDGRHVKQGDRLPDAAAADDLFAHTLKTYEDAVNQLVMVPINQNEFDALVSFTYNEGTGALGISHLLKYLNAGDHRAAADQFLLWTKITDPATGQKVVLDDLVNRRKKERLLFLALVN